MLARHCALPSGLTTVGGEFTLAGGCFAPGHLGEPTLVLPFDLFDAVLEETRCVQRRLRALLSRVGVYFVLAMCLFPEVGYLLVWQKLTAALVGGEGLKVIRPSAKALRDLRRRIGARPLHRCGRICAGARRRCCCGASAARRACGSLPGRCRAAWLRSWDCRRCRRTRCGSRRSVRLAPARRALARHDRQRPRASSRTRSAIPPKFGTAVSAEGVMVVGDELETGHQLVSPATYIRCRIADAPVTS